ncbi:hypothetical protein RF11_05816 [Thelohanellus kitauei]|uniref:Uncharacterized protein n=1 Tax=Thelohanellus kitauei TaxID=669202 RepID=A0A0C2M9V7_THEKT|nr:hypothetical protein RF11_05816 [Thelohanellus kitauei]
MGNTQRDYLGLIICRHCKQRCHFTRETSVLIVIDFYNKSYFYYIYNSYPDPPVIGVIVLNSVNLEGLQRKYLRYLIPYSAKERCRAAHASCEKCQRRDSAPFNGSLLACKNCQDEIYDNVWYAAVRTEVQ